MISSSSIQKFESVANTRNKTNRKCQFEDVKMEMRAGVPIVEPLASGDYLLWLTRPGLYPSLATVGYFKVCNRVPSCQGFEDDCLMISQQEPWRCCPSKTFRNLKVASSYTTVTESGILCGLILAASAEAWCFVICLFLLEDITVLLANFKSIS